MADVPVVPVPDPAKAEADALRQRVAELEGDINARNLKETEANFARRPRPKPRVLDPASPDRFNRPYDGR